MPSVSGERSFGSLPARKHTQKSSNPAHVTLLEKCAKVIAANFQKFPVIDGIPTHHRSKVLAKLATDMDITISSKHIHSEEYWKRCCVDGKKWTNCLLSEHGFNWKQLFFEKNLQELLETYDPKLQTLESLVAKIKASQDYMFSLTVTQLLAHPDLSILFDNLRNLSSLSLTYGVKRLRLRYNRSLFGMKLSDAESLAICIQKTPSLCHLSLQSNLLDDDLLEILMVGLKSNNTITHLDLSHNKITDLGVQILSHILGKDSLLTTLNLCNNQIQSEGGRMLGHIMNDNRSLTSINVRLNRLGDQGGGAIFQGLKNNSVLTSCDMSSNSLGYEAIIVLADLLRVDTSGLRYLDLSSNDITDDDTEALVKALKANRRLLSFDMRMNMVSKESKVPAEVNELMQRNARMLEVKNKAK